MPNAGCDASVAAVSGDARAAEAGTSALPPLPAPSSGTATYYARPARPEPASPCGQDLEWDGYACVANTCPSGSVFKKGRGCVRCLGDCLTNVERFPWSDDPTPFNRAATDEALARVVLSSCKAVGGPRGAGSVLVTLRPAGDVDHVVVYGRFEGTAVGDCIARIFKTVRVPKFGGGPVTVPKVFALD